jgi:hypothetical protein
MPDSEILEWTRAKFRYDAARVKLSNLVSEALSTLNALNQNWRNVWPKGMEWTNQYPKGQLDFDYSAEDEAFRRELRTWRYCRAVTRLFALSVNER